MSDGEFKIYEDLCAEAMSLVPAYEARQFVKEAIWEGGGKVKDRRSGAEFAVDRFRRTGANVLISSDFDLLDAEARPAVASGKGLRDAIVQNTDFLFERGPALRYIENVYRDFLGGRRFAGLVGTPSAREGELRDLTGPKQETRGRKKTRGLEEAEEDMLYAMKEAFEPSRKEQVEWLRDWFEKQGLEGPSSDSTLYEAAARVEAKHRAWADRQSKIDKRDNQLKRK